MTRNPNQAETRTRAFELRRQGLSIREIGARLGISHTHVLRHISAVLADLRAEALTNADEWRALELDRLDGLQAALRPRIGEGDPKAIDTALRIMERRSKLLGLDMPVKQVNMTMTPDELGRLSDDELAQLIQRLQ